MNEDTPQTGGPRLKFFLPSPALRAFVSSYYILAATERPIDDRLHPEWANIRLSLSGHWGWGLGSQAMPVASATVFGPTMRSARITAAPGSCVVGIGLLPLGWARLAKAPAHYFANRARPLAAIWPDADAFHATLMGACDDTARIARLDAALLARLDAAPLEEPALRHAHQLLVGGKVRTVEDFAAVMALNERTLRRLTQRHFGFPPKPLLRRQRFLRTLDRMQATGGLSLTAALDDGYADQAQFSREFQAFMGMAPTAYLRLPREVLREASVARARLIGASLQGLHAPQ